MKRSSCASGSGNVPSYSIGFWVARTMNGRGSACVTPSTVIWLLLHRFEQAGLRLRRRAIDLVGQHDLGDDRTWPELELAGRWL